MTDGKRRFHQRKRGISLVEILIALAIFSTAIVGLFMTLTGLNKTVATSMRRDVEAAYANMVLAQINPYNANIETAYDKTSTGCSGARCSQSLPYGDTFYYTILVDSNANTATAAPATADMKRVNMYLFRDATTSTPYRQFRREIAMSTQAYKLGSAANSASYFKDTSGQVWTLLDTSAAPTFSSTSGGVKPGFGSGNSSTYSSVSTATTPTGAVTADIALWQTAHKATGTPTALEYIFPATEDGTYLVELGFNEIEGVASGGRVFDILINDQTVQSSFDINQKAGGTDKAVYMYYVAQATTASTGGGLTIPVIKIKLNRVSGSNPIISWIKLTRR